MKKNRRVWFVTLAVLASVLLLVLGLQAPGWATPSQPLERLTVPTRTPSPTLVPWAYLPLVVKNAPSPTQGTLPGEPPFRPRDYDTGDRGRQLEGW